MTSQSQVLLVPNDQGEIPYEVRVAGRFKMDKMIGSGSFGEIYMAKDIQTDKEVAVKFEQLKVKRPQVIEEAKLLKQFQGERKCHTESYCVDGFPKFVWYGQEN